MTEYRKFTDGFKAKMVLELLTDEESLTAASRESEIIESVLSLWNQEFIERSARLLEQLKKANPAQGLIAELERSLDRMTLKVEMAKKVITGLGSRLKGSGWSYTLGSRDFVSGFMGSPHRQAHIASHQMGGDAV